MKNIRIEYKEGRPSLMVNEKQLPPVLYGLSDFPAAKSNTAQAQRNIANFAAQGVRMVTADTNLAYAWHKFTPFDVEPIQAEIAGVLDADPDSMVLLRLHMNPPYWWLRDHPEETAWYNGAPGIDDGEPVRMIRDDGAGFGGARGRLRVCLGSKLWLKEAGEMLRLLCEQLSKTPEAEHLLGIQVACGIFGEWHQWGNDDGPCMEKRFREYLKDTYGTDENLQKAWGRNDVTLESAPFQPNFAQSGDDGIFRDPIKSRNIMDAQMAIQMTPPEAILHFCRIIKENWPWPILAGSFYGYYMGSANGDAAPIEGHLRPDLIFKEPGLVDCLCAPFPYMKNRLPEGAPMSRGLLESMRLNHALWLTEMDQHPVGTTSFRHGGDPAHYPETFAMLRRNCLLPLMGGMGYWYYDHRIVPGVIKLDGAGSMEGSIFYKKGWWDHPELMKEIGKIQRIAEKREEKPYAPVADVLVVYDTASHFAHAHCVDQQFQVQDALTHSGAAFDCIYLCDLKKAELDRYRCILFANAWQLSKEQQEEIKALTGNKQVIYFYAAGYSDGQKLDTAHIQQVTGIRVEKEKEYSPMVSKGGFLPADKAELDKRAAGLISPCFCIADEEAQPLAFYEKSGNCCAARKGNAWYFALPTITKEWARAIFKEAGAHIYGENGDAILADQNMLVINTHKGCCQEITLRNGKTFTADLPPFTTAVYDAVTGERKL